MSTGKNVRIEIMSIFGHFRNMCALNMVNRKQVKPKVGRESSGEIGLLDTMFFSLVEVLGEKGILTQEEYEEQIMEKSENEITKNLFEDHKYI